MADTTGWTRREWMQLTTAGTLQAATALGTRVRAAAPPRLGVQLYTVREQMKTQAQATLKAIAEIGYKELEFAGRADIATLVPMAKSLGLTPVSTHIEAPLVTGNWDAWGEAARATPAADRTLAKALDTARSHGIKYIVVSYLQPAERGTTAAAYEKFADQLNRAGETARAAGLTLAYHNHGFEFAPLARRPAATRRAPLAAGSDAGEAGARRVLGVDHRRRSGGAPGDAQGADCAVAPEGQGERRAARNRRAEGGEDDVHGGRTRVPGFPGHPQGGAGRRAWSTTSSSRTRRPGIRSPACGKVTSICTSVPEPLTVDRKLTVDRQPSVVIATHERIGTVNARPEGPVND